MAQHEHSGLRLLPYHPKLNPIEQIWAQVRNHVGTHKKVEDGYLEREPLVDEFQELIIEANTGESDEDFSSEDNDDEDGDVGCFSL
jgi:transposase